MTTTTPEDGSRTKRGLAGWVWGLAFATLTIAVIAGAFRVADDALQPGATVSGPMILAFAAYVVAGAAISGILIGAILLVRRDFLEPRRPVAGRRPTSGPKAEGVVMVTGVLTWALVRVLDLVLVTPGEHVARGLGAKAVMVFVGMMGAMLTWSAWVDWRRRRATT